MKSENQEKFEKGNMVVSFKYFDSTQAEAYKSFFEVNGVQVIYLLQNDPRITHVIYKRDFYSNDSFTAIVSGLCVLNNSYVQACMKANKILTNFSDFELMSSLKNQQIKPLSDELAAIVGVREASEGVVGKKLGAYIKENKLHDPNNTHFRCDEKLKRIFPFEVFYHMGILMHLYKYNHILH